MLISKSMEVLRQLLKPSELVLPPVPTASLQDQVFSHTTIWRRVSKSLLLLQRSTKRRKSNSEEKRKTEWMKKNKKTIVGEDKESPFGYTSNREY
mmetsp:Transcript_8896/g.10217  ORF Transcript_8896/g.10217 Transcript_8896/m.10217 type:complete len:95 (-) Transcript_8896:174-458(-)